MSFQLIHTSALQLLDSTAAGYGTVARSEGLPKVLCTRLSALSVFREPRSATPKGPQYSYHIIDHAGASWHALTCVQAAGADYSGRGCFIAHHLVLSQEEVRMLMQSELRPTPAGVMLALTNNGFWRKNWRGEPACLSGEPELRLMDLPDASTQPVWKRMTGHKANARAFYTSPFERDCIVTVPDGTTSTDVLHLFHESDWLTHTRGWGVTFTTVADEADSFAETLRMATHAGSPLVRRALRTGHPVLEIEHGMELPLPEPARVPPASAPLPPGVASKSQQDSLTRTLSRSVSHYHYTEEPDWLLYDVPPPGTVAVPRALLLMGAAGCLALAAWCCCAESNPPTHPSGMADRESLIDEVDNLQVLDALLKAEYNHEAASQMLNRLAGIAELTPEDSLILEATSLILGSQQHGIRHAAAIKRLCECARLLGLRDVELVRLYLHEATHSISPEQWQAHFDGQQLSEWLSLKQSEPQIAGIMQTERLRPYAPSPAVEQPSATILATADSTPTEEVGEEPAPNPGRVSLIPVAAVSGAELPDALEKLIPNLPVSISTGNYVVAVFAKGGELQPACRLNLSADGYHLYVTPTENPGEFLLKPEHKEGKPTPAPAVTFSVRAGRLQHVRCDGAEAVVSFPIPTQEGFHINTVLASSFGILIPPGKGITLPPAARANLEVTPDLLEIVPSTIGSKSPQIRLRQQKRFPWTLSRNEVNRIRFSVKLPVLTGLNGMRVTEDAFGTYEWIGADVLKETGDLTTLRCEIEQRPDLPGRLERAFERVANSPCCGEVEQKKSAATLGHLYYICCALANDDLSRRETRELHQAYFDLFANKQFNKVLLRILAQDKGLHLTPEEASSNKFKCIQVRNNIKKQLSNRGTRDLIRRRICEVLTRTLYAAYTQEQTELEKKEGGDLLLILKNISVGDHVELLWQFEMQKSARR